jgi:hypothetical protein
VACFIPTTAERIEVRLPKRAIEVLQDHRDQQYLGMWRNASDLWRKTAIHGTLKLHVDEQRDV